MTTRPDQLLLQREFATDQKVTEASLDDIGRASIGSIMGLLAILAEPNGVVSSGLEGAFEGDGFLVSIDSGLTLAVEAGFGFMVDSAESDAFGWVFKPMILEADDTVTLDAHDTFERIDVVYATPTTVSDESSSERIWDSGSEVFNTSSINVRTRPGVTLTVSKGDGVSIPTLPLGSIAIAHVTVPANSGAVTIVDQRRPLTLTTTLTQGVDGNHAQNWVVSGFDVQNVVLNEVFIFPGEAYNRGRRTLLTKIDSAFLGPAPSVSTRYDLVVQEADGTLAVVQGVEGGGEPTAAADQTPLWVYTMETGGGGSPTGAGVDRRPGAPFTSTHLDDDSVGTSEVQDDAITTAKIADDNVTAAKLGFDFVKFDVTDPGQSGTAWDLVLQLQDLAGDNVESQIWFEAALYDADMNLFVNDGDWHLEVQGTGASGVSNANEGRIIGQTSATGTATLRVNGLAVAATRFVRIRPLNLPAVEEVREQTWA